MAKPSLETIRRRFGRHAMTKPKTDKCEKLRERFTDLAVELVGMTRGGVEQSRALNKLHESMLLSMLSVAMDG